MSVTNDPDTLPPPVDTCSRRRICMSPMMTGGCDSAVHAICWRDSDVRSRHRASKPAGMRNGTFAIRCALVETIRELRGRGSDAPLRPRARSTSPSSARWCAGNRRPSSSPSPGRPCSPCARSRRASPSAGSSTTSTCPGSTRTMSPRRPSSAVLLHRRDRPAAGRRHRGAADRSPASRRGGWPSRSPTRSSTGWSTAPSWHQRRADGDLAGRAGVDTDAAIAVLSPIPFAVGTVLMIVVSAIWMLAGDPVLGGVAVAIFPVLIVTNVAISVGSTATSMPPNPSSGACRPASTRASRACNWSRPTAPSNARPSVCRRSPAGCATRGAWPSSSVGRSRRCSTSCRRSPTCCSCVRRRLPGAQRRHHRR